MHRTAFRRKQSAPKGLHWIHCGQAGKSARHRLPILRVDRQQVLHEPIVRPGAFGVSLERMVVARRHLRRRAVYCKASVSVAVIARGAPWGAARISSAHALLSAQAPASACQRDRPPERSALSLCRAGGHATRVADSPRYFPRNPWYGSKAAAQQSGVATIGGFNQGRSGVLAGATRVLLRHDGRRGT